MPQRVGVRRPCQSGNQRSTAPARPVRKASPPTRLQRPVSGFAAPRQQRSVGIRPVRSELMAQSVSHHSSSSVDGLIPGTMRLLGPRPLLPFPTPACSFPSSPRSGRQSPMSSIVVSFSRNPVRLPQRGAHVVTAAGRY